MFLSPNTHPYMCSACTQLFDKNLCITPQPQFIRLSVALSFSGILSLCSTTSSTLRHSFPLLPLLTQIRLIFTQNKFYIWYIYLWESVVYRMIAFSTFCLHSIKAIGVTLANNLQFLFAPLSDAWGLAMMVTVLLSAESKKTAIKHNKRGKRGKEANTNKNPIHLQEQYKYQV